MFGLGNSAVLRLHKTWEVRVARVQQPLVAVTTVVSLCVFAENPEQDEKNLLCLREADGESSTPRFCF